VIKFVSDLRHISGFLLVLRFPPPIKLTRRDITEILLKVALNTINQPKVVTVPNKITICIDKITTSGIQIHWVGIQFTGLTPPHCYACPNPGLCYQTLCVEVFFMLNELGDRWLFVLLLLGELLTITASIFLFHNCNTIKGKHYLSNNMHLISSSNA
jgi:hypothetical protein